MADFIDVSEYQWKPNWGVVSSNIQGAVVKAYENRVDHSFYYNWNSVAQTGRLWRSAYCFATPRHNPVQQANLFADIVLGAGYTNHDPGLVLDAEVAGITPDWCIQFLNTLDGRTGRRSILYTYLAFLRGNLHSDARLNKWPLWIAAYQSRPPNTPWPYVAWQYSSSGSIPGISGRVDVNYGDLGGSVPVPPTPQPTRKRKMFIGWIKRLDGQGIDAFLIEGGYAGHQFTGPLGLNGFPQSALDFKDQTGAGLVELTFDELKAYQLRDSVWV